MERKQVIERLCALVTEVGSQNFNDILPHDCFCGNNTFSGDNFQCDDKIIEFIEYAVREKIYYKSANG